MKNIRINVFKFLSIFIISTIIIGYLPKINVTAYANNMSDNNADYLGNVTFYDYYGANKIGQNGNNNTIEEKNGNHYYFEKFNNAISDYSRSKNLMYPLYFGDFNSSAGYSNKPEENPETGQTLMGNAYKFFWVANRASRSENEDKNITDSRYTASIQGLVSSALENGNLVQDLKVIDFDKTNNKQIEIDKINTTGNASYEHLQESLGRNNVLKLNYPGSSGSKDFRVELKCKEKNFSSTDKYLTFDLYNESNGSGGSVFIAIKDNSGNQMAGWSKFYGTEYYDNTIQSKNEKSWQTIVVDLEELRVNNNNQTNGTYNPTKVDFSNIQSIFIGYWGTGGGVFIDKSSLKFLGEIVDKKTGSVAVPYFNSEFLNEKNVGRVTDEYEFPFKKRIKSVTDITGNKVIDADYYIFSSGKSGYKINNANNIADVVRINENDKHLDYWFDVQNNNNKNVVLDMNGKEANFGGQGNNEPGFFPFNDPSQGGKLDDPKSSQENGLNYGFGAKIEIKFKLTKDGTMMSKDGVVPLEFNFKGDDDVWVYIDDQLALDMGGGHSQTEGNVNFAKGKATVKNVVDGKITSNSLSQPVKTKEIDLRLSDDSYINNNRTNGYDIDKIHTITLFYMERGMIESNFYMDFNFVPADNELIVEKEVDTSGVNEVLAKKTSEIANNIDFGFNIHENGSLKNDANYILNANNELIDKTITQNKFELKHSNLATFYNAFLEESKIKINEIEDNRFTTTWITKNVSNKDNEQILDEGSGLITNEFIIPKSTSIYERYIYYAKFINSIKTGKINITKEIQALQGEKPEDYKEELFNFKVEFTSILGNEIVPINYNGKYYISTDGIEGQVEKEAVNIGEDWVIQLKAGETAEIRDIPINTKYKITEILDYKYDLVSINGQTPNENASIEGEITSITDAHKITYVNEKKVRDLQLIKVDASDSTIKLSGAEFTLNKLKEDGSIDEKFSQIVATTDNKGEITFKDLTYGKYVIKEITAPEGYQLLRDSITVDISDKNDAIIAIQVKNSKNIILPVTGSSGMMKINYIGFMLVILAVISYGAITIKRKNFRFK